MNFIKEDGYFQGLEFNKSQDSFGKLIHCFQFQKCLQKDSKTSRAQKQSDQQLFEHL